MSVTTNSTGDGVFRMLDVAPGRYRLTATLVGHRTIVREGVVIQAGETFALEQTLEELPTLESVTEAAPEPVSVYRNGPLVQTPPDVAVVAPVDVNLPPADKVFSGAANRWAYEFPDYRRYAPPTLNVETTGGDVQITRGHWYDPFNQNRLKGDYPVWPRAFGQQMFLNLTAKSETLQIGRRLPVPSGLASEDPDSANFFGRGGQYFLTQNFSFSADLFHGDTAYRPADWRVKFTPEINVNFLKVRETGIVSPDPRKGTTRFDTQVGLQEAFVEARLKTLSNNFDFVSARGRDSDVQQRFSRLHLFRSGAGAAIVREPACESLSIQRGVLRDAGEGHELGSEYDGVSRAAGVHREFVPAGFLEAGVHDSGELSLRQGRCDDAVRYESVLGAAGAGGRGKTAQDPVLLLRG